LLIGSLRATGAPQQLLWLGLPRGQPLPSVQSRLAADVARRLLLWASQADNVPEEPLAARDGVPEPGSLSEL
jgi:hypothetical protein